MGIRMRRAVGLGAMGLILGIVAAAAPAPARAASISGAVINQGTGAGMVGVPVSLFDPAGDPIATVNTGAGGTYSFNNLPSGNYLIQEATPNGFYQTNPTFPNYAPTNQTTPPTGTGTPRGTGITPATAVRPRRRTGSRAGPRPRSSRRSTSPARP